MTASTNIYYPREINAFSGLAEDAPQSLFKEVLATPLQVGLKPLNFYGYNFINPNAVDVFIKLFNKATIPTLGTTVPDLTIQVSKNGSVVLAGSDILMGFSLNMWIAATTGYLKTDSAAPGLAIYSYIIFKDNQ